MKIKAFLSLLIILAFPITSRAQTFKVLNYNSLVHQGGVLIVKIAKELKNQNLQLYVFDELYSFNENGVAFVGISVDYKPDCYPKPDRCILYLVETEGQERVQYDFYYTHVQVLEKDFGTPWYAGPSGRPNKTMRERRQKEALIKDEAYALADIETDYTSGPFIRPLDTEETDGFGTLRLYGSRNRKTKKIKIERKVPHGGVDLRARTPLPVMAINSGKVLLTHNFSLRGTEGNMLIIDHGSGILSLYLHLSKFKVKVGDTVTKGQIVALTGKTPKGTPPHLHFMVKINGTNVDPLEFIDTINAELPFGEKP